MWSIKVLSFLACVAGVNREEMVGESTELNFLDHD